MSHELRIWGRRSTEKVHAVRGGKTVCSSSRDPPTERWDDDVEDWVPTDPTVPASELSNEAWALMVAYGRWCSHCRRALLSESPIEPSAVEPPDCLPTFECPECGDQVDGVQMYRGTAWHELEGGEKCKFQSVDFIDWFWGHFEPGGEEVGAEA